MIIFMGVAGSGKSVQGRMLADRLALPWLSTGEFLRMLISGQDRKDMVEGKLLNDKQIIKLVQKIFNVADAAHQEFVLDGFPRTAAQADWLLNQAKHGQLDITAVVHLVADDNTVKERLLDRGRQDDTEDAIDERFREFESSSKPIIEHFKQAGVKILDVNAEGDPETIHENIRSELNKLKQYAS